jgi:hypothetical protein
MADQNQNAGQLDDSRKPDEQTSSGTQQTPERGGKSQGSEGAGRGGDQDMNRGQGNQGSQGQNQR